MEVPLLNFEEGPRVLILNFESGTGVTLLNFEGVPKSWVTGYQGPGVLVPLLQHAFLFVLIDASKALKVFKLKVFFLMRKNLSMHVTYLYNSVIKVIYENYLRNYPE